ncbi:MAG: BMP family ABC transporter substrate-binding protein [Spirochaetia bacterium]|nr:BMP family ABC transporter substrate-binding protein [Spirochaetia bacterium]
MKKLSLLFLFIFLTIFPLSASGNKEEVTTKKDFSILVFISGNLAGSPPYQKLNDGAIEFSKKHENIKIKTYEAGFNQAEWESQLTSLVATNLYDIVLTTNPSLSEICDKISKKFPNQKFLITDAYFEGNPNIATFEFNQYQQSYILGRLAAMISRSNLKGIRNTNKLGFVLSQEYPLITEQILPGYLDGAHSIDPAFTLDKRIIGNWYDADKASELTSSIINNGSDVIATISGSASIGVINSAKENNAYIVFHNDNIYNQAPGVVLGCGAMNQDKLALKILDDAYNNKINWGQAEVESIDSGFIDFYSEDPIFIDNLPQSIRLDFISWLNDFRNGIITINK